MKYCTNCGMELLDEAIVCVKCGISTSMLPENASERDWLTALLLAIFIGGLGIHRFYVGKIGTGIIMVLLCWTGISSIWAIIDIIFLATGKFKDKEDRILYRK